MFGCVVGVQVMIDVGVEGVEGDDCCRCVRVNRCRLISLSRNICRSRFWRGVVGGVDTTLSHNVGVLFELGGALSTMCNHTEFVKS